ncbi:hypothetical protein [Streptomyces zaomyceticus]|uniref:hypothetical protein n=1 Tax=Streptomyces zaomyceticus TaxID=68286 RepID=UPI0036923DFC
MVVPVAAAAARKAVAKKAAPAAKKTAAKKAAPAKKATGTARTAKKAPAPAATAATGATPAPAAPGVDPAAAPAVEPEQAPAPAPPEIPIPDALKRGNGGAVDTGAGVVLGIFGYALLVNYLRGGPTQVKAWLSNKFVNKNLIPKATGSTPRPQRGPKHSREGR